MFYRYTMGFRPYLFDIKIDLCQWINKTHKAMSNPAFERIFNGFLKSIPNLFVKCPFEGHYQSEWVDANNSFSPFLPPVVAAGRYKTIYHVYSSESPKILKGVTQFDIKPRKEFRVVGLLSINFNSNNVERPFMHATMFYRYTMGFRPYLLNARIDLCKWINNVQEAKQNLAFERIFAGFTTSLPSFFAKCPFEGRYVSGWIDANKTFSQFLPPVVAAGRYKTIYHVYSKSSPSILKIITQFDVKPRREFRVVGKHMSR
uniref:CSON010565 protein n=1 Tax=Culicoides sonorensis TaxID=179676 RepID=A0A336KGA0_CULSO